MDKDNDASNTDFSFTDIDLDPITCDTNPAHFDGFLYEIADFCKRTGKFLPLLQQGVTIRGHKTVVDSPAAVPFIQGGVTRAKDYDAFDPCPPTSQRLSDHNSRMQQTGSPQIQALTKIDPSNSDFTVNRFLIDAEDLTLGNAIANCFVGYADFINRLRGMHGMGGRAMIQALKTLALDADPAQRALVIRQFSKYAEAPVAANIDSALFELWYKKLQQKHRQLPKVNRKSDGEICEYLNILFFSQHAWRDIYEIRISAPGVSGDLTKTLTVIRRMLEQRSTYAQLDAEQHGEVALTTRALGLPHNNGSGAPHMAAKVTGEANNNPAKRAFAYSIARGDTAAAFSVAADNAQAGLSRATADPKKIGVTIDNPSPSDWQFTQIPRDAKGNLIKFVPGARKCHCDGAHLFRDCPHNDMWSQGKDGKWKWIGGSGWTNGKPPANFDRKKVAEAAKPPLKSKAKHFANVVDIDEDRELAEQLFGLWSTNPKTHSAKVAACDCSSKAKECMECDVSCSCEGTENVDGDPIITPIDEGALHPHISIVPPSCDDASLPLVERHLRLVVGAVSCNIAAAWSTITSTLRNLSYTITIAVFVILFVSIIVAYFSGIGTTLGATSFGVLHSAVEGTPTAPDHSSFVSMPRLPSTDASGKFLKLFFWIAASVILFEPAWFWFVASHFPIDALRAVSYCYIATPLAAFPQLYSRVLGLDQGNTSFFLKATRSINKLRTFGGMWFSILAMVAIYVSRFSPIHSSPSHGVISAPAFPDASSAPNVTGVSLPFIDNYLPFGSNLSDGAVHSITENHDALLNSSDWSKATSKTVCSSTPRDSEITKAFKSASQSISSLPLAVATVDSGCSASCTGFCDLLIKTKPCDEIFGAANGILARATMVGNLPIIARASDGQFVHFVLTNVRCVPEFSNFTLLSVDQMWEEQQIRSTFCDAKQLTLPNCSGGHVLPYDEKIGRNTIKFASATRLYDKGLLSKPTSTVHSSKVALGFHNVKSTAHISRLTGSQVGELFHRRWHRPVNVIRNASSICADTTPNLSRADPVSCEFCAACNCKKASHGMSKTTTTPSSLDPCHSPGTLHVDLKGMMVRSVHGYHYAIFAVEEYSRYIFVEFLKTKETREQVAALARIIGRFNSMVNVGSDVDGKPLPKPTVSVIRSDHEGAFESQLFDSFRTELGFHSTMSPPHDHDLNPIAESAIGTISDLACCIRGHSGAPRGLWPHVIEHAVNIHNSTSSSCGTSSAESLVSAYQRLTLAQPSVMDIASFGCMAVALKSPPHRKKTDLSSRGWVGKFMGRSLGGQKGQWDILTDGKIVSSSSVQIDEENFPWRLADSKQTLCPARPTPSNASRGGVTPSIASLSDRDSLTCLNLFSGPYTRAEGLSKRLLGQFSWKSVVDIDNDPDTSGGWDHDLLNDETFARIFGMASNGTLDAIMVAFPCSPFSASRFFPSDPPGPPPVHTFAHPDGVPLSELDPRHHRELRETKILLDRTIQVIVAARNSSKRTTVILENPAARNIKGTPQFGDDTANHGSLFDTSAFKQLVATIPDSSTATFAYCRLGSEYQKYTTLWYTNEAASTLDQLNSPIYKCNHAKHAKVAGGRLADGSWASSAAAAYPSQLNLLLAMAFTFARTGDPRPISQQAVKEWQPGDPRKPPHQFPPNGDASNPQDDSVPNPISGASIRQPSSSVSPSPSAPRRQIDGSPLRNFPNLDDNSPALPPSPILGQPEPLRQGRNERSVRSHVRTGNGSYGQQLADAAAKRGRRASNSISLSPIVEVDDSPYDTYSPFDSHLDDAVAAMVNNTTPIGPWVKVGKGPSSALFTPHGGSVDLEDISDFLTSKQIYTLLSGSKGALPSIVHHSLFAAFHGALRADSPGAPNTHDEAMRMDSSAGNKNWFNGEATELANHERNGSWKLVPRTDVPKGRHIHKFVWVYKVKRNGEVKVRLCVQGCTLESGVDFDQNFSSTLRHCSARCLCAHAARRNCSVRSIDFVSAYLQGVFLDGEVLYCHMPAGYVEKDGRGDPFVCCIQKPIYGVPQAGRRLQRCLFDWMLDVNKAGLRQLDDSDNTIFVYDDPRSSETFAVGIYVDNLQIVHSARIDDDGVPMDGNSYLAKFLLLLRKDWEIVDEGPMDDLLGMEFEYFNDGSIKLHQKKYIEKLLAKFLPHGPPNRSKPNCLPYSSDLHDLVDSAISEKEQHGHKHPELISQYQQLCGSYLYLVTATRPDIAYVVCHLCRAMACPTPTLLSQFDLLATYLYYNASIGITYTPKPSKLRCYADASWDTRFSTSGWVTIWQSAALSWGSRKQNCVALSSCESEIIALSECAKDAVHYRKKLIGIDPSYVTEPTPTATDNKGAHDLSYNPEFHNKTKHIQRRHFYVRDVVESQEIVVPLIKTDDNPADFFTKPVSSEKFFKFRDVIMNVSNAMNFSAAATAFSPSTVPDVEQPLPQHWSETVFADYLRSIGIKSAIKEYANMKRDYDLSISLGADKSREVGASHFTSRGPWFRQFIDEYAPHQSSKSPSYRPGDLPHSLGAPSRPSTPPAPRPRTPPTPTPNTTKK